MYLNRIVFNKVIALGKQSRFLFRPWRANCLFFNNIHSTIHSQMNPLPNWGPMMRAKASKTTAATEKRVKNQGKFSKRKLSDSNNSVAPTNKKSSPTNESVSTTVSDLWKIKCRLNCALMKLFYCVLPSDYLFEFRIQAKHEKRLTKLHISIANCTL